MNYVDKMNLESRLMKNLRDWMLKHGEILEHRVNSDFYACFEYFEVKWRSKYFNIQVVDGMVCRIEKMKKSMFMKEVDKVEFIERCVKDVISDLSDSLLDERPSRTSEIIRDYKSEALEDYNISEETFDRLYEYIFKEEMNEACACS